MKNGSKKFNKEEAQRYWRDPPDKANKPQAYATMAEKTQLRSQKLVEILESHVRKDARVLEIGCNAGRNLAALQERGYAHLDGIDINPQAHAVLVKNFPRLSEAMRFHAGSAEDILPSFRDNYFDCIFTMAALVHIAPESDAVFDEMCRCVGTHILLVEMEWKTDSSRHFTRLYREIFESRGFQQIEEVSPYPGVPKSYVGRLFKRL
jgi:ubiquinone/menaquinone biosynthesis C-methylase UbiE